MSGILLFDAATRVATMAVAVVGGDVVTTRTLPIQPGGEVRLDLLRPEVLRAGAAGPPVLACSDPERIGQDLARDLGLSYAGGDRDAFVATSRRMREGR